MHSQPIPLHFLCSLCKMGGLNLYTNFSLVAILALIILSFFKKFTNWASCNIFLLDFSCYKGKLSEVYTKERAMSLCQRFNCSSDDMLDFVSKILDRTGVGHAAYLAEALVREPPNPCLEAARKEAEDVLFGAVDQVLEKSGVKGEEIGIVIVNCTVFNVVPCLTDMIVNKYKLGEGVLCYNLTGMGCSAGLAAVGLAKQLLQVHPNTCALVLSTENITQNYYMGKNRSMIIANALFRLGGAAALLSNRPSHRPVSKYQLIQTVHNITASHDRSYKCIIVEEDEVGKLGITITKDLMVAAIMAIEANVAALARLVLPISEQIKFLTNYLIRYFNVATVKPYVPNFGDQFDHFFPHVGGKPVLDELAKNLRFSEKQMEASRMTLYRFGNTSSSSIWYALAYAEAKGRIKRDDRLWQFAFGSGFKCSSVIWRALRKVDIDKNNPWMDEIDAFPVDVSKIEESPIHFEPSKEA